MVPGKRGLQGRSDRGVVDSLGWTSVVEDVEDSEEDHVAGMVERIAHTMLEDDDEETQRTGGWEGSLLPQLQVQSTAQVFASDWDKRMESMKVLSGFPEPIQKRIESEAMELLYAELVRLKMEELAAAQQQLSFYQNAFMDSRQSLHPAYTSSGLSSLSASSMLSKQHGSLSNTFHNKQVHRCSGGVDWSAANMKQCSANGRSLGQGAGAPLMYPTASYLTRTTLLGMPVSRESCGTGVFLPRCRTGARNSRTHDSRRKSGFKFAVPAGRHDLFLPDKAKDEGEKPSLQYPLCSPSQEVAPDISLPTEWTY